MRYYVGSEGNPRGSYLVDLLSYEGRGECSCKDWSTRRWPAIRDGGSDTCKHVRAARDYFLNGLLRELSRQQREPQPRKQKQ